MAMEAGLAIPDQRLRQRPEPLQATRATAQRLQQLADSDAGQLRVLTKQPVESSFPAEWGQFSRGADGFAVYALPSAARLRVPASARR